MIDVASWHIAAFRCDEELGRYRGIPDIGEAVSVRLATYKGRTLSLPLASLSFKMPS